RSRYHQAAGCNHHVQESLDRHSEPGNGVLVELEERESADGVHRRTPPYAVIKIRDNLQSETQLTRHEHELLDDFSVDRWSHKHLVDELLGQNALELTELAQNPRVDRKSTRLNSSHQIISY